jgi:lysophospholipase L1-like esterase
MTPTSGGFFGNPSYGTLIGVRTLVNQWIEQHAHWFDGVLHFGEAVQEAQAPQFWNPALTIGDQTHPNPLGHEVMANSIPLDLFKR